MSEEKKGTFGSWLIHVAIWLAIVLFAMNQGSQVVESTRSERFTIRAHDNMLCAVVVQGRTQSMECFYARVREK